MGTPVEIMLPTSVNLDTIVKNGFYYIGATPVNGPTESATNSQLLVVSGGTTSTQLIFIHSTGTLWVRTATNSVWGPWHEFLSRTETQAGFAALAGSATQTFDVADATAASHAVALGQAQADFAPILTVNAPVDRLAALDALATLYTNPGPTTWVDSLVTDSTATANTAITVNGVLVATLTPSAAISVITPPVGTIQVDTTLPLTWVRTTL